MDIEQAIAFTRSNNRAVLATKRGDGRPQLSLVTVAVDDDSRILMSTRETAIKTKNLRRDPFASLLVFTEKFFGDSVQLEGDVEIISLPDAMDLLVDYYRRAAGEHPNWDEYRAAMERDRRVIVRISVTRAGPNAWG